MKMKDVVCECLDSDFDPASSMCPSVVSPLDLFSGGMRAARVMARMTLSSQTCLMFQDARFTSSAGLTNSSTSSR